MASPWQFEEWSNARFFIKSPYQSSNDNDEFPVPDSLKYIFLGMMNKYGMDGLRLSSDLIKELQPTYLFMRSFFEEGFTRSNYVRYFHRLLWLEEVATNLNLSRYNMSHVTLDRIPGVRGHFLLAVEGLAEKRPSVQRGNILLLRPCYSAEDLVFECVVKHCTSTHVELYGFDEYFNEGYTPSTRFDVQFVMWRGLFERMHEAVDAVMHSQQIDRVFPILNDEDISLVTITRWFNKKVKDNEEQRAAVEHIVSGTSGTAPYIVFGPPGTGKTMTIVEAIIQLVSMDGENQIMVCTESNMAADHISLLLLQYSEQLEMDNLLLRANAQRRDWSALPPALAEASNGSSYETFNYVSNEEVALYRILVTTLSHAAVFATDRNQMEYPYQATHLFIDEAGQASEPVTLVPVCGLLAPHGQLILAGDPNQLGPVCMSRQAKHFGLGRSLLERLLRCETHIYRENPQYNTMLVKNYRSNADILNIPNKLFYEGLLQPLAKPDILSNVSILGLPGGDRSIVFHAVNSLETRGERVPSYYNEMELIVVMRYVKALVDDHCVQTNDIGIITPYIIQVHKMKNLLRSEDYHDIEVGTVEAFQGKEKRVILISTVRGNSHLLDHDAKFNLGFLVDDTRFNVAITRAIAKLVIVGNPYCLSQDSKWRMYMDLCAEYNCYHDDT